MEDSSLRLNEKTAYVTTLQEQVQKQRKSFDEEHDRILTLSKQLALHVGELEQENIKLTTRASSMEQIMNAANQQQQSKESHIKELDAQIAELQTTIGQLESKLNQKDDEIQKVNDQTSQRLSENQAIFDQQKNTLASLKYQIDEQRQQSNYWQEKSTSLETKLSNSVSEVKSLLLEKNQLKEQANGFNSQLRSLEQNSATQSRKLEETQKLLDSKTKELMTSAKRQNMLAMAKSKSAVNEVIGDDKVESLMRQYEQNESVVKQEREQLQTTMTANQVLQEQVRAAQYAMVQLEDKTKTLISENIQLKTQSSQIKSKSSSDQIAMKALQTILSERQ